MNTLDGDRLTLAAKTHQRPSLLSALLPVPLLICLLVALVALTHGVVYAASITVTTTDDELNADGDCSLREAIVAANTNTAVDGCTAGSGADTIFLPAGTYVLTMTGTGEDEAATGDLDIRQSLTINGEGESTTIIDGNATDRVFHLLSYAVGAVTVSFSDVTITNGDAGSGAGGGIYNRFGNLTLTRSSVVHNIASGQGGGVYNRGPFTVSQSSISNNTSAAEGGGICSWDANTVTISESEVNGNSAAEGGGIRSASPLDITGTTISHNTATGDGGGIWHILVDLNLTDSAVSENSGANGGGIYAYGTAVLISTTVSANTASASGGGIFVDRQASAELTDSEVSGNSATMGAPCYGGGIYVNLAGIAILNGTTVSDNSGFQGGGLASHGTVRLTHSTVSSNTSDAGGGGIYNGWEAGPLTVTSSSVTDNSAPGGGGIYLNGGNGTVTDSTIRGNNATGTSGDGGGIDIFWGSLTMERCTVSDNSAEGWGGGINVRTGSANLTNSTISGNSASQGGGGILADGTTQLNNCTLTGNTATWGGGLYSMDWSAPAARLHNSIVAGNTAPSDPTSNDCGGTINSQGHNLYGGTSCTPAETTDLIAPNPFLDALQDNGGPTLTHALLRVSPAVDAADNTNCPATDQRGQVRPVEANGDSPTPVCDIGAFELAEANLVVAKVDHPDPVLPGQGLAYGVLVVNQGPDTARDLVLTETMPPGLDFTIETPECTVPDPVNEPNVVRCDLPDLVWGQQSMAEFSVPIPPDFMVGSPWQTVTLTNTATLASGMLLDDPTDNTAGTETTVEQGQADLRVAKTMEPQGTIWGGHPFTYTILIENTGPSVAEHVQFSEDLTSVEPAFGSVISAPNYTCIPAVGDPASGTDLHWNCTRNGLMYPQEQDEITIVATVEGGGAVTNSVSVSTVTEDPYPTNDLATSIMQVVEEADLEVAKFSEPEETGSAGVPFTYTVQLSNHGPSGARNVIISDTLLSDFTTAASIASAPGYTCDPGVGVPLSGQQLHWTCTRDAYMYFDVQDEITIVATGDRSGEVNNLVEVTTASSDPQPSNNRAEDSISLIELADLHVVKMSKPDDTVLAGDQFSWYIFVQNNGPSPARNVQLTDNMLSDGQFSVIDVTHGPEYDCTLTPSSGGYDLNCSRTEALPPGAQDEIIIQALSAETCDINNQVWVTTASPDPDTSSNYAQDSIHVGDTADLALTKTATGEVQVSGQQGSTFDLTLPGVPFPESTSYTTSATEVTAGRRIQYTLTVDNAGPSTAENVQVTDRLPAGVTLYPESLSLTQGSCETGTPGLPLDEMVCGLGALDSGQGATITFQILVGRAVPEETVLENDASVSSDVLDLDNSDNHVHTLTTVNNWADLLVSGYSAWGETAVLLEGTALVYQEYPDQVTAGRQLRYEITVENRGPGEATDVTVQHWVEYAANPMMTFLRADGASCSPDEVNRGLMYCQLGTLAAGATKTINLYFLVFPGVPPSAPFLHSQVDVSSSLTSDPFIDAQLWNDTWVIQVADLSIRKGADAWKVYAGEEIRYDISVTNRGPSWAWYVTTVTDTFPEWVEFEVATLAPEQCVDQGSDLVCTWRWWDPIPNGETRSFSVFARVRPDTPPGTIISNEALVASTQSWDPLSYNDRDTAANLIRGKADLKIQKFGKPEGLVAAGEELTYTVIVDNLGPGYAHDVLLTDLLESSGTFELISVTSNRDADCTPISGSFTKELQLTCSLTDTLEVATTQPGSGRWMLTVVVQAAEAQDINNVAKVASSDYDPDPSNNEAIAEHEITAVADLEITKTAWGEVPAGCGGALDLWENEVAAGGTLTYTVTVTNHGPSTAENVVVRDQPLPSLVQIQEITPSQGNCDEGYLGAPDYLLTCNLGTLLPDQSETVTIVVSVPPTVLEGAELINVARVYSDMFDDSNGNDVQTNRTIVSIWSDLEVLKTQDPEIALPGWDITYSVTVTNLGPSDAEGIFISDTIPIQFLNPQWTCCASDDGDCDVSCEPPVCPEGDCPWPDDVGLYTQADIPAGEWVIYTVEGTLDWWPCGPFTNTVEVIAPPSLVHEAEDIDPCDENNVAFDVNDPMCHFDPLVLKDFPGPDSTD